MGEVEDAVELDNKIKRRYFRGRRCERKKIPSREKMGEVEDAVKVENEMRRMYFRVRR